MKYAFEFRIRVNDQKTHTKDVRNNLVAKTNEIANYTSVSHSVARRGRNFKPYFHVITQEQLRRNKTNV